MNSGKHRRDHQKGFTLLEVMLALAIFVTAAVGLMQALNTIGLATSEAADQYKVDQHLKSLLNETCFDPELEPGTTVRKEIDPNFVFEIDVTRFEESNDEGITLNDMYRVRCSAFSTRSKNQDDLIGSAERIIYRELWRRGGAS